MSHGSARETLSRQCLLVIARHQETYCVSRVEGKKHSSWKLKDVLPVFAEGLSAAAAGSLRQTHSAR